MNNNEVFKAMHEAILNLDKAGAKEAAEQAIHNDLDLNKLISESMSPAMGEVGEKFQRGEMFLPELQMAADVFEIAMKLIEPKLLETRGETQSRGMVVIGTVKGDLHSIGKDLVATMLRIGGFEVLDLGIDISTLDFMEQAEKSNANVIALSALLTTTVAAQREVIEALKDNGIRDKFKVIIGGAPVNQEWADGIGADAYGENAAEAVELVKKLCS